METMSQERPRKLGLALSGGGSRAAAFHCGTLKAIKDLDLLTKIDIVSTVSGGSLFGSAWAASIAQGTSSTDFITNIEQELNRGFVWRTISSYSSLRALLPGFSRTDALANTFDRVFFKGMKLRDLPIRPALCMNVTVLNNGQVGKFSKEGFRATGITPLGAPSAGANIKTSIATVASACHPAWLPQVVLKIGIDFPVDWDCGDGASKISRIALTDGGVIENLGIQTLLKSRTFGVDDIITSDAGTSDFGWRPSKLKAKIVSSIPVLATLSRLLRAVDVMSQKQDRHMRSQLFLEQKNSRLKTGLPEGSNATFELDQVVLRAGQVQKSGRKVIMVRVDQTLDKFLRNIPIIRLSELARDSGILMPNASDPNNIERFLVKALNPNKSTLLSQACNMYRELDGDNAANRCSQVRTNFTSLSQASIRELQNHAYWQMLACFALYW